MDHVENGSIHSGSSDGGKGLLTRRGRCNVGAYFQFAKGHVELLYLLCALEALNKG